MIREERQSWRHVDRDRGRERDPGIGAVVLWAPGEGTVTRGMVERARALVPDARIFAAVLEQHSPWWGPVLADLPRENIIEQPFHRGTATGVLAASLEIRGRWPRARAAAGGASSATGATAARPGWSHLAEGVNVAYLSPTSERTAAPALVALARSWGGQRVAWDPPVIGGEPALVLGEVDAVLELFAAHQPELSDALARGFRERLPAALDRLFPFLPCVDFTREVLEPVRPMLEPLAPHSRGDVRP